MSAKQAAALNAWLSSLYGLRPALPGLALPSPESPQ